MPPPTFGRGAFFGATVNLVSLVVSVHTHELSTRSASCLQHALSMSFFCQIVLMPQFSTLTQVTVTVVISPASPAPTLVAAGSLYLVILLTLFHQPSCQAMKNEQRLRILQTSTAEPTGYCVACLAGGEISCHSLDLCFNCHCFCQSS